MAGTISALNGLAQLGFTVSMESGLDGRNNVFGKAYQTEEGIWSLNGVRPRWPEQWPS